VISINLLLAMSLKIHKNIPLVGSNNRPIVTDFTYNEFKVNQPIVVFCHGYKGFKDWGAWSLMCQEIAKQGYFVLAMNFSHNGGTIQQPIDFPDLEAFGNDNFSKQQNDLQLVIDQITDPKFKFSKIIDSQKVILIGHSRGGGASIIKTANESKVTQLITLASISTYDTSFPSGKILENWKKTGVWHTKNGRTLQEMPHYIQFYEDYKVNQQFLNIEESTKKITVPHLLIHGTSDTSVAIRSAEDLSEWNPKAEKFLLDTNHVFGAKHPWISDEMPEDLKKITRKIIAFLGH